MTALSLVLCRVSGIVTKHSVGVDIGSRQVLESMTAIGVAAEVAAPALEPAFDVHAFKLPQICARNAPGVVEVIDVLSEVLNGGDHAESVVQHQDGSLSLYSRVVDGLLPSTVFTVPCCFLSACPHCHFVFTFDYKESPREPCTLRVKKGQEGKKEEFT